MSRIKTLLPDDFDGTDPREDHSYNDVIDISPADHYYLTLYNALDNLETIKPVEYLDELKYCRNVLDGIIESIEKPF
jgi:uncharacterized protein YlbG (UPF0298 family)